MLANLAREDFASWTPLLELAAREVFQLMLHEQLAPGGTGQEDNLDLTSMVGLAGRVCGVISVRCSTRAAHLIAACMLGTDAAPTAFETWDALGEICNMVAGNFKNKITGMGDGCMISVPTVISGGDYSVHSFGRNERAEVQLSFQALPLVIAIEVHW